MDLIDKQKSGPTAHASCLGGLEHFLQIGDTGKNRGNLFERKICFICKQARNRRLSGARRTPEDQGTERSRFQHA